ncbi:deoxyguanosinetriphosphate triphosphohydrolase [Planctomycetota bacterium]
MELADFGVVERSSRGRALFEKPHRYRTGFERDRDRIIHCEAFRRLEGKTQVFMYGINDNYRNRLTHSIEVAQIGRTVAKGLNVNESLTEAICLAHDLGHSPFGHTGESVLNDLMAEHGGFEHNRQSLRIVDLLEHPYPDFVGLNLMYETRLGLAKHRSPYDDPAGGGFSEKNCSMEGQIADVADRIAYNCHDLEDGMRAGVLSGEQLKGVAFFDLAQERVHASRIAGGTMAMTRTAKAIIDMLVSDVIDTSRKQISDASVKSVGDVYAAEIVLVGLSGEVESRLVELEKFLLDKFYLSEAVTSSTGKAGGWLEELFGKYCESPELMPCYFCELVEEQGLERSVCDYVAGMTDRFCLKVLGIDGTTKIKN